jgi:hypothetical protein
MSTPASAAPTAGTVPVPLAALAVDGVSPAQGDNVSFTVTGRIVSAEGQSAQVQVETINDQPIAADEAAEDLAMREAARASDEQGMAY